MSRDPDDTPDMDYGDSDPKYDNFPITEGDVERTDVEWIGFTAKGKGAPRLYEPHNETTYEGTIDEENERVVLDPDSGRELGSRDALGEYIEEVGDEHGWHWLSDFAEEHVESDESEQQ